MSYYSKRRCCYLKSHPLHCGPLSFLNRQSILSKCIATFSLIFPTTLEFSISKEFSFLVMAFFHVCTSPTKPPRYFHILLLIHTCTTKSNVVHWTVHRLYLHRQVPAAAWDVHADSRRGAPPPRPNLRRPHQLPSHYQELWRLRS